jgi:hypothetical protein
MSDNITLHDAILERRTGSYECPAHSSKSKKSVSLKVEDGTVLLHDFGGCSTKDILGTLGLDWRVLFDGITPRRPQPERQALQGFHQWRQDALSATAAALRERNAAVRRVANLVKSGAFTEAIAFEYFEFIYADSCRLEWNFEMLLRGSDSDALEVYRRG